MSNAFERFVAGQDTLSALLKALPGYRPTAAQEAAFTAAARAARPEDSHTQMPQHFEPPEHLLADFRTRAAQLDMAALAQRKTVLKQIQAGTHPDAILRNRVHPATTRWLRAQAAQLRRQRLRRMRRMRRSIFDNISWSILGRTALAGVLAALLTRWLMTQAPSTTEVAFLEAFRIEALRSESAAAAQAQPDVPQNQVSARSVTRSPRLASPQVAAPPPREADPEPDMRASDAGSAPPANLAPASLAALPTASAGSTTAPENLPFPEPDQPERKATMSETAASTAPAGALLDPSLRFAPQQTFSIPQPPPVASRALGGITARLEELPVLVAKRLPERPAGMVWLIRTPAPTPGRLRSWLEAVIHAIPEPGRPARFSVLSDLPPGSDLHIYAPPPALSRQPEF